jgi:hypothetical protein
MGIHGITAVIPPLMKIVFPVLADKKPGENIIPEMEKE